MRSLAHNFVHKKCAEAQYANWLFDIAQTCFIFDLLNFPIGINGLNAVSHVPHKFIHRNCEQLDALQGPGFFTVETQSCHDCFLRKTKYPLRIKALAGLAPHCAHFYPQKV